MALSAIVCRIKPNANFRGNSAEFNEMDVVWTQEYCTLLVAESIKLAKHSEKTKNTRGE